MIGLCQSSRASETSHLLASELFTLYGRRTSVKLDQVQPEQIVIKNALGLTNIYTAPYGRSYAYIRLYYCSIYFRVVHLLWYVTSPLALRVCRASATGTIARKRAFWWERE